MKLAAKKDIATAVDALRKAKTAVAEAMGRKKYQEPELKPVVEATYIANCECKCGI